MNQRIPVMAGGMMMMIPNVRSWSTLAHISIFHWSGWLNSRIGTDVAHVAGASTVQLDIPADTAKGSNTATWIGRLCWVFPKIRGPRCLQHWGSLQKMGDEPSCPFVILFAPRRRFQHLVGDIFHGDNCMFYLLDWVPICLWRMKVDLGTCGPVCKDISRRTWSLADLT